MLYWLRVLILTDIFQFDGSVWCRTTIYQSVQSTQAQPRVKTQIPGGWMRHKLTPA